MHAMSCLRSHTARSRCCRAFRHRVVSRSPTHTEHQLDFWREHRGGTGTDSAGDLSWSKWSFWLLHAALFCAVYASILVIPRTQWRVRITMQLACTPRTCQCNVLVDSETVSPFASVH